MKNPVILGGFAALIIGGISLIGNTEEIFKETVEVEKTVEVNVLDKRVQEAQDAALASTTAKAQAAYDKVIESERTRIADEVKTAYIAEIESTISADSPY